MAGTAGSVYWTSCYIGILMEMCTMEPGPWTVEVVMVHSKSLQEGIPSILGHGKTTREMVTESMMIR